MRRYSNAHTVNVLFRSVCLGFLFHPNTDVKYYDHHACMFVSPHAYLNKSSAVARMGDRCRSSGPKSGGGADVPLSITGAELGLHLAQCRLGRDLPLYQVVS